MKLYIAMIASVMAISGCKKDGDSGAAAADADAGGGAGGSGDYCVDLAADYCSCDGVTAEACAAYEVSLEGYSSAECEPVFTAWEAAGGCASMGG